MSIRLIFPLFIFFLASHIGFSQSTTQVPISRPEPAEEEPSGIDQLLEQFRKELEQKDYLSAFEKEITISFQLDTFRLGRQFVEKLERDRSPSGKVQATYEAEKGYDQLLSKYYQLLLNKLSASDREALKMAQRNWVFFRDSERKLNNELGKDEYSGEGSDQRLVVAVNYLDLSRKRLIEIHQYLLRFQEK